MSTKPAKPIQLWRYAFPSRKGEGWAIFVLGSDGYFSVVSDFGNYSYIWSSIGCDDFREFLLEIESGYLLGKISRQTEWQGEEVLKSVKQYILEHRRDGSYTREEAREEWDLLQEVNDFYAEGDFQEWYFHSGSKIQDAYEFSRKDYPTEARNFCTQVMPRLREVLKAELAAEKACVDSPK